MSQYAGQLFGQVNGETIRQTNALLLQRFGKPVQACTLEELTQQIAWLEKNIGFTTQPAVNPSTQPPLDEDHPGFVQGGLFDW